MNIFLAGATGAIGRPLLPRLIDAGHTVTALTRSAEGAAKLRQQGAQAIVADIFDRDAVIQAVIDAQPDAVINQLTSIPHSLDIRKIAEEFVQTNRLRTEGTQILMDAARAAGARHFIAQSFAPYHTPHGAGLATEDDGLYLTAPASFAPVVDALAEMERIVLGTPGITGTVLRYGNFYGPGTGLTADGGMIYAIRERQLPLLGGGNGVFSFIHTHDAADATVAALNAGKAGVFNIVDDDPAPLHEWAPFVADLLGAPAPMKVPQLVGRLAAGRAAVFFLNGQRGVSNEKAKRELGWLPAHATWREGFREELAPSPEPSLT
jgi:nucleoside-diphosphate-sugar epimerase